MNAMQSKRTSSANDRPASQELLPAIAVLGIVATGMIAALLLPIWMAAIALLIAYSAIRVIAMSQPTTLEPVVIRRDRRR